MPVKDTVVYYVDTKVSKNDTNIVTITKIAEHYFCPVNVETNK